MKVVWTSRAELSYLDEIEFILGKWNINEVQKFVDLVEDKISSLKEQPNIGKPSSYKSFRKLKISKQTSLFYMLLENEIELSFFWNNRKNPIELSKYLK